MTASEHSLGLQHSGAGIYTASKQAVLALADVLRDELPEKVGISVFCPGIVATGLGDAVRPAHLKQPHDRQRAVARAVKAHGMTAESVARAAIEGTLRDDFLIVTHPHSFRAAERRFAQVEAGFAEQAPWTEEAKRFDVNRIVAQVLAAEGSR